MGEGLGAAWRAGGEPANGLPFSRGRAALVEEPLVDAGPMVRVAARQLPQLIALDKRREAHGAVGVIVGVIVAITVIIVVIIIIATIAALCHVEMLCC